MPPHSASPPPVDTDGVRRDLLLYVNGRRLQLAEKDVRPEQTLLQFLRQELGLTGTKLGCGEGGCGACTVTVSKFDVATGRVRHMSVNSCLAPLCAMDACAITTVEGVGLVNGLHEVQQALAESHASQCGYCTPGFVMALYSMVKQRETGVELSMEDIEHGMDGNLCRCTGYRPILDAAKSFGDDAEQAHCKGSCPGCPNANAQVDIEDLHGDTGTPKQVTSCSSRKIRELVKQRKLREGASVAGDLKQVDALMTSTFPQELVDQTTTPRGLQIDGERVQWFAPVTMTHLLQLKRQHPVAKISVGNTEMGIETKFKGFKYAHLVNVSRVPELVATKDVTPDDPINQTVFAGAEPFEGVKFGAAVTLTDVKLQLSEIVKTLPSYQTRAFEAIVQMLKWFASTHIRNVACIAGNLVTASPISDMNPLLAAMNAYIELQSTRGARYVRVRDFFLSYRKVGMEQDEVITGVYVPYTKKWEYMLPFKQARRREDDISIVTAGIRVELECSRETGAWTILDASAVYGGMAPVTKPASETEHFLIGKVFDAAMFDEACDVLHSSDFKLPDGVPGGMAKYRESLCSSFLYKFFIASSERLQLDLQANIGTASLLPEAPAVDIKEQSASKSFLHHVRSVSRGIQSFGVETGGLQDSKHRPVGDNTTKRGPVGDPLMHKSAYLQVSGEALYTDDIPNTPGTLHGALVLSTCAHGLIESIDASEALVMEGVHRFFDASVFETEKLGSNKIGPVLKDEECFASKEVLCVGQPVGIIVADTHELAMAAADKVKVVYEELPSVTTIEEAIREKSFILPVHTIDSGNVEKGLAESDIVLEGEVHMGGQEQFYFETNVSLCTPQEGGMKIISSTQAATKAQMLTARVLGINSNRITSTTKRIGGGFGGKETRTAFVTCAAAVAAHVMKRPVKCLLERHVDMLTTGGRHPFYAKYKVGIKRDGSILALDVDLYNNAGYSMDLSLAVMDRALFHCENSYKIPNLRCNGTVCRTNLATNTAFRGFGGPQGLFVAETYIDHIARTLKLSPEAIRSRNMYVEGQTTHYGQPLEDFNLKTLWQHTIDRSGFETKKADVEAFNKSNRWRKRGVAILPTKFGISFTSKFMNQGGALVHVYADGSVLVSHGGVEMGQGLHTKVIQVAAHAFGIPHDQVHIEETSTNKVPNSQPSAASMSTDLYGMATLDACEQILARLTPIRERLGPDASFSDVTNAAYMERVNVSAQGFYIVPNERCGYDFSKSVAENIEVGTAFNYFTTGVACTVVELDVLTGDFHMLSVDILMDLGASINPAIDIGQIEGAFMQGFGLFALEELVWGDDGHPWVKRGNLFTRGPGAYKIPSANDVPLDFHVWLESNQKNKFAVHSSKAVGEPPLFLGSSAFFAVKEAIYSARADAGLHGYFELRSPVTPERARMACADDMLKKVFTARGADMVSYQPSGSF
ncbi:Xanthine dehydrogenase [Phytophthora fragariae]|uniref:Xanthine dehydrogenase n=1 Tax=Phytophthora fragariae TaxID=53985 RepID=A0A6A3TLN3_9STRA|nr:Xanthine dehydrogenase [Phytophthora fragariae]KAE8998027.1 Xanthine dehydrogenase [Phytophthora fragariae]KAE9097982.1 Xanthine dehydrogenase [Phytophthora fragariae]KAE9132844.1 Xanthine dehydrogenase [Phytophthora fragariae]KAE9152614.1 Xanthine dehydrogenase [Phytophthora fragariae]